MEQSVFKTVIIAFSPRVSEGPLPPWIFGRVKFENSIFGVQSHHLARPTQIWHRRWNNPDIFNFLCFNVFPELDIAQKVVCILTWKKIEKSFTPLRRRANLRLSPCSIAHLHKLNFLRFLNFVLCVTRPANAHTTVRIVTPIKMVEERCII